MQRGMENALKRLQKRLDIQYDTFFYRFSDWEKDARFERELEERLTKKDGGARRPVFDAVLSVNYSPLISKLCEKYNVKYIAWVYDCPLHIRNLQSLYNSCNRIWFFDRGQAEYYKKRGVTGARHLPLAVDTDIYDVIEPGGKDLQEYSCDISLVGKLYKSDYAYLCGPLTQRQRGYLEGLISAQSVLYGGYILGGLLDDKLLEELNVQYAKASYGRAKVSREELEFAMNCEITGRERYMALALLSKRYRTNVYSGDCDERLTDVHFGGYLDYYTRMPKAFKQSRINLNISFKAIQTGIPLRVFDVLGCGGFLLTNYQEEIAENFTDGKELVMYSDMADLVAKAGYYLKHEDERLEIAKAGYDKVKKDFSFDIQMEKLLEELR